MVGQLALEQSEHHETDEHEDESESAEGGGMDSRHDWAALYRAYHPLVHHHCRRFLATSVAADDATHATLTNTPGVHRCTSRDCTLSCAQSLGADSGWRPEGYAVGDGISPYREGGA